MPKKKTKNKILADHKRSGKKFIPPMADRLGSTLVPITWADEILPELLRFHHAMDTNLG